METEQYKNLKTYIEALTHSGSSNLDEEIFKKVKKICKSSENDIPCVYSLVKTQLGKKNSQIRLSAFQIIRELFKRSALFRGHVLRDLHVIFELTAEINTPKKLPPPKSSAESLKSLAVSTLKEWVQNYGETYKKLKVAYNYFEKCKKVDFQTLRIENSTEQIVESEQQRQLRVINSEKLKKIMEEFNNNKAEIKMTITSLSNCLSLLLPPAEEFFIPEHSLEKTSVPQTSINSSDVLNANSDESSNNNLIKKEENSENDFLENSDNLREFGVPLNYNLTLELNIGEKFKVIRTEENSSVFENAKDCVRLIQNRFLPMIKKWTKIYCKCSNGWNNDIKEILDLKEELTNILEKHDSIVVKDSDDTFVEDSSSDDDFEEVKKEGYEEDVKIPEELMLECLKTKVKPPDSKTTLQKPQSLSTVETSDLSQPSTSGESIKSSSSGISERKKRLLSIAPKLPYDIDLYHWEDENLSAPTLVSSKIDVDKFWGSAESDDIHVIPNPEGVAALRTRVIEYTGTFEPVKWACRVPLPNGKLCPRKDRYKCPFHGKIVARDEMGNIQNEDDQKNDSLDVKLSSTSTTSKQDLEFLNDLQAATGVDLKMPDKKGKRRKPKSTSNLTHKKMKTSSSALKLVEMKKLPGLVDVVKRQSNAYTRLSKKIFNRASLRRVSSVLDKLDRKKFQDKYGDQFNYSL